MPQLMKHLALLLLGLILTAAAFGQSEPSAGLKVEELYLAKDDGNGKAGDQVPEFATTDVPIYCVVLLDSPGKVTVKMNFVAVIVAGLKADTKVVTASYTTKDGQNRVNFSGRPEGKWPPGKYRVDIFLDGRAAKVLEFDIKNRGANSGGNNTAGKYLLADEAKPRPIKRSSKP